MYLSKIFFKVIFLSFFLVSSTVLAAETNPSSGTVVATVNFKDVKITSQEGNTFNIAFSLTNREGVQDGVGYGVQLFSETPKGKFLVDEKIFDEKLTLTENSSIRKGITYTAPGMLSGTYSLMLRAKNSAGFPFGLYPLGKVTLTKTINGVQISPESCSVKMGNKTSESITQMVLVEEGQSLELSCSVTNNSVETIKATPIVKTNLNDPFGEIVETDKISTGEISFKPNEKKVVTLNIPLPTNPQSYSASINFNVQGIFSNSVSVKYRLAGASATISNLSLDNDYYKRGETASLSIIWDSTATKTFVEATLTNGSGMKCAKTIDQELAPSNIELLLPINSSCRDPHISVSLKDDKGIVLAQKNFSVETSSVPKDNSKLFILLGVILVLVIIFLTSKKHKKVEVNSSGSMMSIILPIIIFAGLTSFIPFDKVYADTTVYYSGPGNIIKSTVTLDPVNYNQTDFLVLEGSVQNTSPSPTSYTIRLTATNDINLGGGNPSILLIPDTGLAGGVTVSQFSFADFQAPDNGTYKVDFETAVFTPHDLVQFDAIQDYTTLGTEGWSVSANLNTPAQALEFVTIHFDWLIQENGSYFNSGSDTLTVDISTGSTYGITDPNSIVEINPRPLPGSGTYSTSNACIDDYSPTIYVNPAWICP